MNSYRRVGYCDGYTEILEKLQREQNEIFWKINQGERSDDKRELLAPYVKKYLSDQKITLDVYSQSELAEKLVDDLLFYSVLTRPLTDDEVEGIHVNSWEDVQVEFRDGIKCKIDGFQSAQHGIDIIRRLLQRSNMTIDRAVPMAEGSIGSHIRISAMISPIVDEEVGCCCYIRKLRQQIFSTEEYLQSDFASEKELNFLTTALRYGASILLVGKVNAGKTSFLSYLLSKMPDEQKIATVESGAREISLMKRGADHRVQNNVIHLLTRPSRREEQNITQEKLVEKLLRQNAEVIAMAEMRNEEAYAAQEASLVGASVISTAHAGSPQLAHKRVADLCRKRYSVDYQTALMQACEAFPIVAYLHMLPDRKRRIMNISECTVSGGRIRYRNLFEYRIAVQRLEEDGECVIEGEHKQVGNPSDALIQQMKMYGISRREIDGVRGKEEGE